MAEQAAALVEGVGVPVNAHRIELVGAQVEVQAAEAAVQGAAPAVVRVVERKLLWVVDEQAGGLEWAGSAEVGVVVIAAVIMGVAVRVVAEQVAGRRRGSERSRGGHRGCNRCRSGLTD